MNDLTIMPGDEKKVIAMIENAHSQLTQATTIRDSVKQVAGSEVLESYVKQAKLSHETEMMAFAFKVDARAHLGSKIIENAESRQKQRAQNSTATRHGKPWPFPEFKSLEELGVNNAEIVKGLSIIRDTDAELYKKIRNKEVGMNGAVNKLGYSGISGDHRDRTGYKAKARTLKNGRKSRAFGGVKGNYKPFEKKSDEYSFLLREASRELGFHKTEVIRLTLLCEKYRVEYERTKRQEYIDGDGIGNDKPLDKRNKK